MKIALLIVSLLTISIAAGSSHANRPSSAVFMNTDSIYPPGLPFSEAVRVENTIYLSGQVGIEPKTLTLVEGGIRAEAKQTMENISKTLEANGLSMSNIVKCTIMLADISEWSKFNQIYKSYFLAPYPARSAFGANGLALDARVEVECIASVGE